MDHNPPITEELIQTLAAAVGRLEADVSLLKQRQRILEDRMNDHD